MFILAIAASSARSTAQKADRIIIEGIEYPLFTNPMEEYFIKHPNRKPQSTIMSTALWRGYVATFGFSGDRLYLMDLKIEVPAEPDERTGELEVSWNSVKHTVAPDVDTLFIDWFTGILVVPDGELVYYVHMGYGSTYSEYTLLEVKGGTLTGVRRLDHEQYDQFREKQFQEYKKTEGYRQQVDELKADDEGDEWSSEEIDDFLRSYILEYTSRFLDGETPPDTTNSGGQK